MKSNTQIPFKERSYDRYLNSKFRSCRLHPRQILPYRGKSIKLNWFVYFELKKDNPSGFYSVRRQLNLLWVSNLTKMMILRKCVKFQCQMSSNMVGIRKGIFQDGGHLYLLNCCQLWEREREREREREVTFFKFEFVYWLNVTSVQSTPLLWNCLF